MNLAIDMGNTRTKFGLFSGTELIAQTGHAQWDLTFLSAWLTNQKVENVILSTVGAEPPPGVEAYLRANFRFIRLETSTPLPVKNSYRTPETLGKDRLAAVIGAFQLFPGQNSLVVDAGTCITYDLIDRHGVYRGGNISPGLRLRLRAMHAFTARLPLADLDEATPWLGDSTVSAMRAGAGLGAALEMQGFIDLCRSKMEDQVNVILTGGDAEFFVEKLKSEIFVNHHLVLLGLNKILNYNVQLLA